jgi:hypothetical protein
MYPGIPKKKVCLTDVVYIKEGKYRGSCGLVVRKYPGLSGGSQSAYVWIRVKPVTSRSEGTVCLPVTCIDIIEHDRIANRNRKMDGFIIHRLSRPRYPKGYRLYVASCIIYDNWVASFRESDNEPVTPAERYVLNAIKLKYSEDVDDIPDWIPKERVRRPWGNPTPYNLTVWFGLRDTMPWKRIMWTIQTLVRKRKLIVLPYQGNPRYYDKRRRYEIVDDD